MTQTDAWEAFSRWQSSDHTDADAAAILSRIVGWDVVPLYAEHYQDPWFLDGEIEGVIAAKYGLPEHENPPRDLGQWQVGQRVRVYWNLHTDRWSVSSRDTGRVVAHANSVYMVAPKFLVSEAGRLRVIELQRKSVHAYAEGELAGIDTPPPAGVSGWSSVTYNPYRDTSFIDRDTRQPVRAADLAYFDLKDDGKPRVRVNGATDIPIRANGETATFGVFETVFEHPALSLSVRPVVTDPKYLGRNDQADATGWEWLWTYSPQNVDPADAPPVPTSLTEITPTRGDAIREAIGQIEKSIRMLPESEFERQKLFYRRYMVPILAELDLDDRLSQTILPALVEHVYDPDHADNYALHLDQVVAGLHPNGSRVTTAEIKRVIAAMDRNALQIHLALIAVSPRYDSKRGGALGLQPGMTLTKGWSMGETAPEPPPHSRPQHGARVQMPDDEQASATWQYLRGLRTVFWSAPWVLGTADSVNPPRRVYLTDEAWKDELRHATIGTILFAYHGWPHMDKMPSMEIRLRDAWYTLDGETGHPDYDRGPHPTEKLIKVLADSPWASGGYVVYLVDPSKHMSGIVGDKHSNDARRDQEIFAYIRGAAKWLPGVSTWGPIVLAARASEIAADNAAYTLFPQSEPGQRDDPPLAHVLRAQRWELSHRARRRYVGAKLHMGGQLPVRRNYVQAILALLQLVLPIIMHQLGSSLADFNAAPRIERQRKLVAILSSKLWWLSANPITVAAARQIAASQKMQDVLLDLLEKHGSDAVAVAGEAAQAAVAGKK